MKTRYIIIALVLGVACYILGILKKIMYHSGADILIRVGITISIIGFAILIFQNLKPTKGAK